MIRTTPVYVQSKENVLVLDCATGGDSTSGGNINGNIIDLQALPARFTHAQPVIAAQLPGTTSTAGGSRIKLEVRLQHGNSSGGGDMANLSTDMLPDNPQAYYSTEMSTDHKSWSTGVIRVQYAPKCIPLLAADRFIRVQGVVTRVGIATSTAAAQLLIAHLGCNLINADEEPKGLRSFNPAGDHVGTGAALTTSTAT